MAPILSWLDTEALCAKIFVCCPDIKCADHDQISPQQRCKNCKSYIFGILWCPNLGTLEIKIEKCIFDWYEVKLRTVVRLSQWTGQDCVHCCVHCGIVRAKVSYQWTCGDWGWGHHAACRLSPRSALSSSKRRTITDQSYISVFLSATAQAAIPSNFYPKCLTQPLKIIGKQTNIVPWEGEAVNINLLDIIQPTLRTATSTTTARPPAPPWRVATWCSTPRPRSASRTSNY